jgi:hypothetical protein
VRARAVLVVAAAAAAGALLALATDQGGNGRTGLAQFLNALGGRSSPWVIIPFVAAALLCTRARTAALLGTAASVATLTGWYVCATLVEDLGGHGLLGDLRLELLGNRAYFEAGLLTGPIFGLLGCWWRRRGHGPSVALVAGLLLVCEPFVLTAVSELHDRLLGPTSSLPVLLRIMTNASVDGLANLEASVVEVALGVAVVAWSLRRRRVSTTS